MKKQPEQTAQTRQSIIDAFWLIAEKQGIDKVSISEVMKKAGFNRGTFYVYFSDINDLLLQTEKEILSDLRSYIEPLLKDAVRLNVQIATNQVSQFFSQYDDKLFLLLGEHGDPHFASEIRMEASHFFKSIFPTLEDNPYADYITVACSSAFIGMLTYWHNSGRKVPIEEVAGQIQTFFAFGLTGNQQEKIFKVCDKSKLNSKN